MEVQWKLPWWSYSLTGKRYTYESVYDMIEYSKALHTAGANFLNILLENKNIIIKK